MEKTIPELPHSVAKAAMDLSPGAADGGALLTISAVERDTGLSKDVLRMWERRYRFPSPLRDKHGERIYPQAQIAKLRAIKRLMDRGYRPGKIIDLSVDDLNSLTASASRTGQQDAELETTLDLIKTHRLPDLRQRLNHQLLRQGLQKFVIDTVAPLTVAVGEAWVRGEFAVFEEHLYTEQVQSVLRNAIATAQSHSHAPRVLLTTFPSEQHTLGLLMVEAILVVDGATCIPLGTETPLPEMLRAASAHRADVVALSFSAAYPERQAAAGLKDLREGLPREVALWAGGASVKRIRKTIEGVSLVRSLEQLTPLLNDWRASHKTSV